MTFDVKMELHFRTDYGWQYWYEAFSICRNCSLSTTFVLSQKPNSNKEIVHERGLVQLTGSLNPLMDVEGYIRLSDMAAQPPPDHLPSNIEAVFKEGAKCLAIGCWNAAGVMFRVCVDMATRALLPEEETSGLNTKTRRDLGLRLPWLFDKELLPKDLRELSTCIQQDGNDGAHQGTLQKADAEDLIDFTRALLERLYTMPERTRLAQERRDARRAEE